MKNIILVDPLVSGHHLSYIRLYYELFKELGCNVTILTPDVAGVGKYIDEFFADRGKNVEIYELKRRRISKYEKKLLKKDGLRADLFKSYYAIKDFWDVREAIVTNNIKGQPLICFLWLDTYLSKRLPAFWVDMILPHEFTGLYFHPCRAVARATDGQNNRDIHFLSPTLKSKKLRFVGVFDEKAMHRLKEIYRRDVFDALPDVAETYPPHLDDPLIAKITDWANGRKIIVLLGSLDRRKNPLAFFRAAKESTGEYCFVCVGKLYPEWFSASELAELKEIASTCRDRLFFHDSYISSDEIFDSVISISSVLFAAYINFSSSSNMIHKAALHKIPIIVSGDHLMGEQVRDYELGAALDEVTPQSVLKATTNLLENKFTYGFDRFVERNSREKLKEIIKQRL